MFSISLVPSNAIQPIRVKSFWPSGVQRISSQRIQNRVKVCVLLVSLFDVDQGQDQDQDQGQSSGEILGSVQ